MKRHSFKANGLTLNCLDYGGEGKRPMLFIHGGSAHSHWWDFVAPAFCADFHVLALDQRGHGESEWAEDWEYGSRHYVSDLDQVIDGWGLGAPILIGHSMGAHDVLAYAAERSDKLRAMVVIDCPADYSEYAVEFLRGYAEKPPRRFESLEEATRNFKVLPTIKSISVSSGPVGTPVTVTGSGLTQASKLTFGGVKAVFTVTNDSTIATTVPTGAKTGKIAVTTPGGSASSSATFTVN